MRGESPILYKTPYLREFIHVEDAVRIILKLDALLADGDERVNGHAFNVGSGQQRDISEVVAEVLLNFPEIVPTWTPAPPISRVEIPFQQLSLAKLHRVLGESGSFARPFRYTIKSLVNWWCERWPTLPAALKEHRVTSWHG